MSIGVNYTAPDYRVISFDASDVSKAKIDKIVPVPERHKVIGTHKKDGIVKLYGHNAHKICYGAPSGTKKYAYNSIVIPRPGIISVSRRRWRAPPSSQTRP